MPKLLNFASLTFIVTVVGLAIPVWLWRADLSSKSLSLQLASQTPLTSESAGAIKGLEVSMDGVKIASPTLSVVTLLNDGKRPLPTADFEAPVEVRVSGGSRIVRAEVTSSQPKDIEAKLEWDTAALRFVPVLMNPYESITVSIITEGARPVFSSRARVVGVSKVEFVDSTKKVPPWQRSAAFLVAALLLFAASDIADADFWGGPRVVFVRKRAALLVKVVCGTGGMLTFLGFAFSAELDGIWAMVGALISTMLVAAVIGTALNAGAKAEAQKADAP